MVALSHIIGIDRLVQAVQNTADEKAAFIIDHLYKTVSYCQKSLMAHDQAAYFSAFSPSTN